MSAVDDYRRFTLTISGFKTTHEARVVAGGFDEFRLYADRAVAELEAALEHALSWGGLLEFIDYTYPPHIFTGESGDPGPRFIVLLREFKRAEAERDAAIELLTMARQTFDADGNGTRFLSEIWDDVLKDVKRLAERSAP